MDKSDPNFRQDFLFEDRYSILKENGKWKTYCWTIGEMSSGYFNSYEDAYKAIQNHIKQRLIAWGEDLNLEMEDYIHDRESFDILWGEDLDLEMEDYIYDLESFETFGLEAFEY
jgi:cytochrome b involved in lipid metabolism